MAEGERQHSDALIEQQHGLAQARYLVCPIIDRRGEAPDSLGGAVGVSWAVGIECFQSRLKSSQLKEGEKEE